MCTRFGCVFATILTFITLLVEYYERQCEFKIPVVVRVSNGRSSAEFVATEDCLSMLNAYKNTVNTHFPRMLLFPVVLGLAITLFLLIECCLPTCFSSVKRRCLDIVLPILVVVFNTGVIAYHLSIFENGGLVQFRWNCTESTWFHYGNAGKENTAYGFFLASAVMATIFGTCCTFKEVRGCLVEG